MEEYSTADDIQMIVTKPKPARHRWQVGTLSYSFAGIILLFSLLLLGDFAWSLKERSVGTMVQLMFNKLGASDTLNAMMTGAVPSLVGLLLIPVISYRSDRHRGRWGRRIPYLIITAPIAALAMVGLAFSITMGTWLHELFGKNTSDSTTLALIILAFFWIIYDVGTVASNSIFTALINDVVPLELIGRFYGLFRAFSLIAGIIFNFCLLGYTEKYYVLMLVILGAIYGVGFLIMCLTIKEGQYQELPPEPQQCRTAEIKTYFKESFSHRYYIYLFIFSALASLAFVPFNLFYVFYSRTLNISMDTLGKYLACTFIFSLLLSWFIGVLADRYHPLRICLGTLALYTISCGLSWLLVTGPVSFGISLVIHGIISGTFYTGSASLMLRLLPRERFAQFGSAGGIIGQIMSILTTLLIGKILDWNHHNYILTYLMGTILALAALLLGIVVYRNFLVLGGDRGYQPPGFSSSLIRR